MHDLILGVLVVVMLFLGIRLFLKLREIGSTRDDDASDRVVNRRTTSRQSLELKIENPSSLDDVGDER